MNVSVGFLIYAALYRLTVLAVGALSIWLGFRLFNNAGSRADDSVGSASAEGNGFKLALTSILPGTYFALFGTVIISIMLWKGEPQLDQKTATETTEKGQLQSQSILTRYNESNLDGTTDAAAEWGKLNSNVTLGEAMALAKLSALYGREADKAGHLALLAELLRANGNEEEAAKTEQAVEALRRKGQ